jgi:hypothetical protein
LFSSGPTPVGVFRAAPVRASQAQNQLSYFCPATLVADNDPSRWPRSGSALPDVKYRPQPAPQLPALEATRAAGEDLPVVVQEFAVQSDDDPVSRRVLTALDVDFEIDSAHDDIPEFFMN